MACNGDSTTLPKAFSELTGTASTAQLPGGGVTGSGTVVMSQSPALTGTPTTPTASPSTNNTQISSTAYTDAAVAVETSRATTAENLKANAANSVLTGNTQVKRINAHGGTALVTGDIAVSSGWGTSPVITVNRGTDQGASIQIQAKATVAANPTVTITFHDGTWTVAPIVVACRTDVVAATGAPAAGVSNQWAVTSVSATQVVFTFNGTPVANSTYGLSFITMGT